MPTVAVLEGVVLRGHVNFYCFFETARRGIWGSYCNIPEAIFYLLSRTISI